MANNDIYDYYDQMDSEEEREEADEGEGERARKRYVRDREDPMQHYSEEEFVRRYRFTKAVVLNILLPVVQHQITAQNMRGLPVAPILQLLICLRFYATGNFQVS